MRLALALLLVACAASEPPPSSSIPRGDARSLKYSSDAVPPGAAEDAPVAARRAPAPMPAPSPMEAPDTSPTARADAPPAAADPGLEAYRWAEAHCRLELPPAQPVVRCQPVCIKELVRPCPEFKACDAEPGVGVLDGANRRACEAQRGSTNRDAKVAEDPQWHGRSTGLGF